MAALHGWAKLSVLRQQGLVCLWSVLVSSLWLVYCQAIWWSKRKLVRKRISFKKNCEQYEWEAHRVDMKPTSWTPGMSPGWTGQCHWHSLKTKEQIPWDKSNSASDSTRLMCVLLSIVKFHLWHRTSERLSVALGSCFLQDTAAVRVLYCLTEKTGLHQGSLKVKHRHRQMESVKWWWKQERGTDYVWRGPHPRL